MNRPWMPLYVADYRADTAHLSAAQHGAYLLLIMHYWTTGSIPEADAQIARIACMSEKEWAKARPIVQPFFHDGWKHKRIDAELARSADISSKRRASAVQRHSKQDANAHANAQQLDTHARAGLHSQSQRKEEPADAGAISDSPYAFESGVIRLKQREFEQWKQAFSHLDVPAELIAMTEWAGQQAKWFIAVSNALNKKNSAMKLKIEQAKAGPSPYRWNGIEGVT